MSIKLVAGLGNPGRGYGLTRHNLGWVVLDALARKHRLSWRADGSFQAEVARWDGPAGIRWLAKPLTFMNESGVAVGAVARFLKLSVGEIAAVYDDVGIELGRVKVSVTGSEGGHNGVASLLAHLGDGFARYRLGIGPRLPPEMDLKDFVLSKFSSEQLIIIEAKLETYVRGLELLLDRGADQAMNQLNRKDLS
jgi:PTH1 family peptidyl-tRNA hydrolase